MEAIYVIRVKHRYEISSLYPSERRYSSSTVGGLLLVHFALCIISFFYGVFGRSFAGFALSTTCLFPLFTGLLAWKKWYIDRNITLFFFTNILAAVVATFCLIWSIGAVSSETATQIITPWSVKGMFAAPEELLYDEEHIANKSMFRMLSSWFKYHENEPLVLGQSSPIEDEINGKNDKDYNEKSSSKQFDNIEDGVSHTYNKRVKVDAVEDSIEKSNFEEHLAKKISTVIQELKKEVESLHLQKKMLKRLLQKNHTDTLEKARANVRSLPGHIEYSKKLFKLNFTITSALEALWSIISAIIAFRGMRNDYNINEDNESSKAIQNYGIRGGSRRPDTLTDNSRNSTNSSTSYDSLKNNSAPTLPLEESGSEFRERVERFIANQIVLEKSGNSSL